MRTLSTNMRPSYNPSKTEDPGMIRTSKVGQQAPKAASSSPQPSLGSSNKKDHTKVVLAIKSGSVADRIKAFSGSGKKELDDHPDLSNTGKTNPALRRRREIEREEEEKRRRLKELEHGRRYKSNKEVRKHAATKIQSIVRMNQAKVIRDRHAEQAVIRKKRAHERDAATKIETLVRIRLARKRLQRMREEKKLRDEQEARRAAAQKILDEQNAAATRIQAVARSALTRMRVSKLVDSLIADLLRQQQNEEQLAKDAAEEAAALERERLAKEEAEAQRLAEAAQARADREAAAKEEAAAHERERLAKEEAEAQRLAEAAQARANREAATEEELRRKAELEAAAEEARLLALEEENRRKEAAAQERERRRNLKLFEGPLPWGVGLLPEWWLQEVPHNVLFLDSITEEENGEDFEEWRHGNIPPDQALIMAKFVEGEEETKEEAPMENEAVEEKVVENEVTNENVVEKEAVEEDVVEQKVEEEVVDKEAVEEVEVVEEQVVEEATTEKTHNDVGVDGMMEDGDPVFEDEEERGHGETVHQPTEIAAQ
eukprot:Nitzschia sp. Nitz4//scaffold431_size8127//4498//6132//NITZ4_009140-RA/size8127-processed-gene-0.5-mRNA-1//-1//CDS//3329551804//4289//frame0